MKLRDQVAIVTGAGRNIGEEIAKLFAVEGARVAVVDMDAARGGRVAAEIRQSGGDAQLFLAVFEALREIDTESFIREGRVYGGGLYKMEPKELANVPADAIAALLPATEARPAKQREMFPKQAT